MNELATSSDVRNACHALEGKMDDVVSDLKRELRNLRRELFVGLTISMALMDTFMFIALDATLNA